MTRTYLKQTFTARPFPMAIDIAGELIAGPFCVHCGNPFTLHGPAQRCPDRHLHPLFPPPNLPFADERGVSLEARKILRGLRSRPARRRADAFPRNLLDELIAAGYVREVNDYWVETVERTRHAH